MISRQMIGQRGFTLVELMVTVAVVAVLAALAGPSFTDSLARRRLEGATIELSSDLQYARSQSVSNNTTVTLTTSAGGYSIASPTVTYKTVTVDGQLGLTPSSTITYEPLRAMATSSGSITLTSSKTSAQLQLTVTSVGRVSICSPSGSFKGYASC